MPKEIQKENKDRILEILKAKPLPFNLIRKELNMSAGLAAYWLKKLVDEKMVEKLPRQGAGERPAMVYYKLLNKTKGK